MTRPDNGTHDDAELERTPSADEAQSAAAERAPETPGEAAVEPEAAEKDHLDRLFLRQFSSKFGRDRVDQDDASSAEIRAAAARRAKQTHTERRQEAAGESRNRMAAAYLRTQQAAQTRQGRIQEEEEALAEEKRRNIDPVTERTLFARQRYLESSAVREEDLRQAKEDRSAAAAGAVHRAQDTRESRKAEIEAAADPRGAEFREEASRRAAIMGRLHETYVERLAEETEADRESKAASAAAARRAHEAHLGRVRAEAGDTEETALGPGFDRETAKRLGALIRELTASHAAAQAGSSTAETQHTAVEAAPPTPQTEPLDQARGSLRQAPLSWLARLGLGARHGARRDQASPQPNATDDSHRAA